jgi:hypothetical protein
MLPNSLNPILQVVERCDGVRLLPTPKQKEMLHYIGDQGARLMNMEDYRRRQLFFVGRGDRHRHETCKRDR